MCSAVLFQDDTKLSRWTLLYLLYKWHLIPCLCHSYKCYNKNSDLTLKPMLSSCGFNYTKCRFQIQLLCVHGFNDFQD